MPIYSFECQECLTEFEVRATIHEKEEGLHPRCPKCQSDQVQYLIGAALVLHSGSQDRPVGSCGCGSSSFGSCCS